MKKIIIIFALIFAVNIPFLYAQYGDYYDGKNSYSYGDMPSPKKSSRKKYENKNHYIGISPSIYIPTGKNAYIKDYTGVGGGVDLRYKYNLHKVFALAGTFRYNYAGGASFNGDNKVDTKHHLIDMQILAVLQYDDVKATKGFIPYISAGMDIAVNVIDSETTAYRKDADGATYPVYKIISKGNDSAANVGFVVGAGLRYAFSNNFTTGFGVDYTHVFTNHDYSGIRVFIDAGYRF